ncbi:MAG TPA: haloacid dehalogenase-like hydrolase, partial [Stellaceae bacterium]|nr:haloacid dehalogenase-like hydrolase [Stellaceae bacterium]
PEPPLCIDLDGTLTRGDSTVRLGWRLVLRRPWLAPAFLYWDHVGRARLKAEIARRVPFDAASFPYNRTLVAWLRQERANGRRLVLASGSDRRIVAAVARYLGLFDEFLASDGTTNLAGARKGETLTARYGTFDYIGNSKKDVAVWRLARACYLVAEGPRLAAWLGRRVHFTRIFPPDWVR